MGPRARARGNTWRPTPFVRFQIASMGPRARARGNANTTSDKPMSGVLQWGRERALAETALSVTTELSKSQQPFSERVRNTGPASMRGDGKASHKQETT